MSSIIVLDSSDDESEEPLKKIPKKNQIKTKFTISRNTNKPGSAGIFHIQQPHAIANSANIKPKTKIIPQSTIKRTNNTVLTSEKDIDRPIKRIKPTQVPSTTVDQSWVQTQSPVIPSEFVENGCKKQQPTHQQQQNSPLPSPSPKLINSSTPSTSPKPATPAPSNCSITPISSPKPNPSKDDKDKEATKTEEQVNPVFLSLLEACKVADTSDDMEKATKKLLKYYHSVHPDFVHSKGFRKTVKAVTEEITTSPDLIYYKLKTIVDELKARRKSNNVVIANEDVLTTGSERKDYQIKRLNKALYILTKRITKLEEAEVDLADENSTYLQVERLKRRACEIYDKICDLTGESKHARRSVKKPILFNDTAYPQFNRTIQAFVNRRNTFPDFFDVLKCLEHCNDQYGFELRKDQIKLIAQDAFIKIGKLLQSRRRSDLYETVSHFTGTLPDPALEDSDLNEKLNENQKHHSKIKKLIDQFAVEQDKVVSEYKKKKEDNPTSENNDTNNPGPSGCVTNKKDESDSSKKTSDKLENGNISESLIDNNTTSVKKIVINTKSVNNNNVGNLNIEDDDINKPEIIVLGEVCVAELAECSTDGRKVEEIIISDDDDES